ncbi:RNA polymerase sigma factor [Candidatus Uhrbacteria bacterium]|nr:RNA polymerase sigma factor [Candidatus Uhrbacteria bacterium]
MRTHFNEKILLYKVRKGDAESFGPIFDHYHEKIYRFIYLKVPTGQDAEDITAETFLKAWQYLKEQKKISSLQAFLYQIARNLVIDFYRKRGTVIESIDEQEIVIADRGDLTLEEKVMLKSDMVQIEAGLRQLKDAYREVIALHYLNELSLAETGNVIGKSHGATRVLLHRGMKALKQILAETKQK